MIVPAPDYEDEKLFKLEKIAENMSELNKSVSDINRNMEAIKTLLDVGLSNLISAVRGEA